MLIQEVEHILRETVASCSEYCEPRKDQETVFVIDNNRNIDPSSMKKK
jgi:hypothetical protein